VGYLWASWVSWVSWAAAGVACRAREEEACEEEELHQRSWEEWAVGCAAAAAPVGLCTLNQVDP
jgi:hypothetical protein